MYQLYWAEMTGAMAPQVLLEEIGAKYEKIVLDMENEEHLAPEFLAINPMGQIPALVLPDGTLMTESAAIILQLCERHPDAKLAPPAGSPESAHFQRWLLFMASNNYPSSMRFYYSERFTTDPSGVEGVREAAHSDMSRFFEVLNEALDPGPYLLGQTFSAVDVYLWMLVQWHPDIPQLFEDNPRIRQLVDLVQARPAVAWVWAEHEEADA
jgi:glutathione S-transferase/GST-like protein